MDGDLVMLLLCSCWRICVLWRVMKESTISDLDYLERTHSNQFSYHIPCIWIQALVSCSHAEVGFVMQKSLSYFCSRKESFVRIPAIKHNKITHIPKVNSGVIICHILVSSHFRISGFLFISPDGYFNTTFGIINPGLVSSFIFFFSLSFISSS